MEWVSEVSKNKKLKKEEIEAKLKLDPQFTPGLKKAYI